MKAIPQTDPHASYLERRNEIDAAVSRVLNGGWYILGREVAAFEAAFAAYVGTGYGIGVGNGTDALVLALKGLGIGAGETVATVSHTAVATVAAIELAGARPLLVDIDPATYTMDPAALSRALEAETVAAIIPVHLYGHPADISTILRLARGRGARVIEDCAQAHGASWEGRRVGSFGDLACFSFYPTKNLGAFGDGGMVVTGDQSLAAELRALREYGWRERYVSHSAGLNTRLDELHAAMLAAKIVHLDEDNRRRQHIAAIYDETLAETGLCLPERDRRADHVFHQYVVRIDKRDRLQAALKEKGIGTGIHYPVLVHLQPAYAGRIAIGPGGLGETERAASEVLSLPMYPQLAEDDLRLVVAAIRQFAASL